MPEPSILFTVTGVVVVALAAWLVTVLKKSNEPWARAVNPDMVVEKKDVDVEPPLVGDAPAKPEEKVPESSQASADPGDATAEATALAVKDEATAKEAEKTSEKEPEPDITTESKDEEKKSDA